MKEILKRLACWHRRGVDRSLSQPVGHLACIHIDRSGQSKSWPQMQAHTFTAAHLDPFGLESPIAKSQSGTPKIKQKQENRESRIKEKKTKKTQKTKGKLIAAWTGQPVAPLARVAIPSYSESTIT